MIVTLRLFLDCARDVRIDTFPIITLHGGSGGIRTHTTYVIDAQVAAFNQIKEELTKPTVLALIRLALGLGSGLALVSSSLVWVRLYSILYM